jgi:hypothetical protein
MERIFSWFHQIILNTGTKIGKASEGHYQKTYTGI